MIILEMIQLFSSVSYSQNDTITIYLKNGNRENILLDNLDQVQFNEITKANHYIPLKQGWNLISSYVQPQLPDSMQYVCDSINDKLTINKNGGGKTYIPVYHINQIGTWNSLEGYQAYLTGIDTLIIRGMETKPELTPILLNSGWSLISYLGNCPRDIVTALSTITDSNRLVIAKNASGKTYIPSYFINQIGNMVPGEGYQIYMAAKDTLLYPANPHIETVIIGSQEWMVKNLDVSYYRNGDSIPQVTNGTTWSNLTTGAWCYNNNDSNNNSTYGKLYNWYAVNDPRGLAPSGWHVVNDKEWKTIEIYLGMSQSDADNYGWRGTTEGGKLKETGFTHWNSPNIGATNSSGFFALPGGYRFSYGSFSSVGSYGIWWSSTEFDVTDARYRIMYYNNSLIYRDNNSKKDGFSVRCIRD